jgi:predicted nucleotidyltransferase
MGREQGHPLWSVARGDYTAASDIDLLIIKDTPDRLLQRIVTALELCSRAAAPFPVEPLVYTCAEFKAMLAADNPLVAEAMRSGRVLHDQPGA